MRWDSAHSAGVTRHTRRGGGPLKTRVIVDMDPGVDDAVALAVALRRLDVLGVCTVAGNASLAETFQNAWHLVRYAGSDLPVLAGADQPLFYPLETAKAIHGPGGLANQVWPNAAPAPGPTRAWHWVANRMREEETCHLIATGPLTNVATFALAYPDLRDRFATITCMAGVRPGTKLDKTAEFNVYVDPHAADAVFLYGSRVRLVGINVCHQALVPIRDLSRLKASQPWGSLLYPLLTYYADKARGEGGDPAAFPVDDVVAVAAVDVPDLFRWESMPLTVVMEGPLRGTVVISPFATQRPDVQVATAIDVPGFLDWLWTSFEPSF